MALTFVTLRSRDGHWNQRRWATDIGDISATQSVGKGRVGVHLRPSTSTTKSLGQDVVGVLDLVRQIVPKPLHLIG